MAYYKGKDIIFSYNNTVIAACKSCDISIKDNVREVTSPSSGKWKSYISGVKEWSLKCTKLMLTGNSIKPNASMVGNTYTITIGVLNADKSGYTSDKLTGTAICTQFDLNAAIGQLAKGTFTFKGTGALA